MRKLLLLVLFWLSSDAIAYCFNEAGLSYGVDPVLLVAICDGESSLNPLAQNINYKKGIAVSEDMGLCQINSTWLKKLKPYNITRETLYLDPCVNLKVGAWILTSGCDLKNMSWDCVGVYNAGPRAENAPIRYKYSLKVFKRYQKLKYDKSELAKTLNKIPLQYRQKGG